MKNVFLSNTLPIGLIPVLLNIKKCDNQVYNEKINAKREFSFGQNTIRGHPTEPSEGDCSKPCSV